MSATVADLNPKALEDAKRQFVELYGSALVMNTYLKIALVLVALVALGLLALNFVTAAKYAQATFDDQSDVRSSRRAVCIDCGTRSVRISRCVGRRRERFRSSPGIWISPRRSGTCTSVPRRSTGRSGSSIRPNPYTGLETFWRRTIVKSASPCRRAR